MRSIVRGIVALFAAFLMMDVAKAAPTIVSPADYATVKTMTDAMHDFLYSDAMLDPDTFTYTQTEYIAKDNEYRYVVTDERKAYMAEYNSNTIPVVFKWSAATDHSGDYTVTVKRVKDGKTVFTQTTSSTTVTFYDPEVGRNYIWTVTDNTGSATGHFYTDRRGPRIIYSETSHLTNTRDLGGWTTTDGKVVKQGLIYRAPEWEWSARQKTETGNYFEMPYLRDVLGIKLEVDLRGRDSNTGGSSVTGQTYIDYFKCGSVYESTIDSSIPRFFCEHAGSTVAFPGYEGFNSSAANRIAVWHTFTNFCDVVKADGTTKPVIFHCSHGKDRTGSLAYVLLGVLGVPRDSLERDWALSWYSEGKYDVCMNKNGASKTPDTTNEWALDKLITAIDNNYSGATLKERCYNYLLACAKNASVSEANAKALIDNYISIMLEEPETAAVNPDPNAPQPPEIEEPEVEVDEFVYTDYYFRGFGSFNAYYRWYKDLNQSSMCKNGFSPISYNYRIFIQPNATETQALGTYSRNATEDQAFRTGMIVCDASKRDPNGLVGIYDCAFYFSSEGHTVSERCIFEHRAGRSEWIGTHLYFVDPYNTSKSVYDGLASIDVWGGSTMCISGFISKTPNKTYLKFPADNCNNARVEVFYDDKENYSTLGWFTGGSESTKQYFQVTNAFMQFTTSGKVNGVAGALGLEFGLGVLNKTTTDPLLKITGTFKVNPGSTITVNAGGKSAGTYKLISAGTLNDGADLVANSSVVNCASGHYGVVRKSGNAINLVIIKGTPPSTGDTVIDPTVYGSADTASSTYTWLGYTGPWAYTTNWTASASANYGIPNNGTYATADFPATLANAFTCTLNQSVAVNKAEFNSPNMTFVLDNALLTLKGKVDSYAACDFGDGENDNSTIELRGANAGIVSDTKEARLNFGCRHEEVTPTGTVTVRFIVPETGWESDARLKATGIDSKVVLYANSKLEIDATALGVPAEGTTKTVYLASGTGDDGVYVESKTTNIVCAAGAKGSIKIENMKLVLTVEAGEIVEEPVLTAVDAPVAQTGLVYTGSELTGVVASTGYTLTGNMATDAGEYTALATLAEGYKWSDDTTADKSITWVIAKATNEWTTEPSISLTEWTQGEAAGVLTSGVAKFGTATSSMTELPTTAGNYTITYTVAEDKNYTGLTKEVSFTINAAAVDPDQPGGGDDTDDPVVIVPTINPDWGYVKTGLGAGGDEVAVVFTNHFDKAMTWTVPQTLKNVQFLVVGGGGGGASGTSGPGGGGGGVVIGSLGSVSKGLVLSVIVGNGGSGNTTDNAGAGKKGNSSKIVVEQTTWVEVYGGGAGGAWNGGAGGSGGGSRSGRPLGAVQEAIIEKEFVTAVGYGCQGSVGDTYAGGGGGGAIAPGGSETGNKIGRSGGVGLLSDITGTSVTYGSGGGGGTNASAGTAGSGGSKEAGNGGREKKSSATSGMANTGGGGGGGGYNSWSGGNGGSGVVVFRYGSANISVDPSEPEEPVLTAVDAPEAVTDLVYTGSELTGVVAADGYTLAGNTATDAGTYEATATLAEGYKWSDDTTAPKKISWSIAKATNEWTTEPSISLESWTQGETAGVLTAGVAKFGEVTSTMTELPTDVGSYTITYTVAETKNYTGLAATVQFEIKEMVAPGDLIAVKPTVNYASGTKFTAIGVEQKPILTPVSGEGYKVSYEGDFTSSGAHKIIITLDNNWKWNDGSSDTLVYQYTFVDRNFTQEFYASGSGRFQSASRWYTDDHLTTPWKTHPTEYTHKAYSTTEFSVAHMDDSLETKVGMVIVSGGVFHLTYGVLNFQNETATPLPMWVTESGCMSIVQGTELPLNGGGVGYFELAAGATNRFGTVDASENFYIRYATDGNLGSVTEFYDSGDSLVNTKLGWFEGGAEGIVSELIVTNTSVKFAKVGAISGVAGPLAVTVALGENNIEKPSIDVAGTLKINQGSTLNVNANGMPCGVYTIITAGEFIGADILTSSQGGVVTGLAENTSGVIEREGNTIKLYIETTILPTVPGIDGESVSIKDVFNSARVSKPIWYKTRPEIIDGKIVFNRIPVEIPEYYNVSVEALTEGYLIKLVLKDNLTPYIGNKVDDDVITTPAIKVENGTVKIHLEGTHEKLHYSLMTSTSVDPSATWTTAAGDWTDNANFTFGDGDQKLDDVRFFKVGEVSDEPIE